jgi:hypothetical protein
MSNIVPFDFGALANVQLDGGAFADVAFFQYNELKNDGDGRLTLTVAGAQVFKGPSLHIVIGNFGNGGFTNAARQFYMQGWKPGMPSTRPDCASWDGVTPNAGVPHPQAASCEACPRAIKAKDRAGQDVKVCGQRKDMLVFEARAIGDGQWSVDTDTLIRWDASSLSLFPQMDPATQSGGFYNMVRALQVKGLKHLELVVFELGFHQGSKAPTLRPVGILSQAQAQAIVNRSRDADAVQLLERPAYTTQPAQAAAPAAAPVAPVAPAPVQTAAPVAPVFHTPAPPAVAAAPLVVESAKVVQTPQQVVTALTAKMQGGQALTPEEAQLLQTAIMAMSAAPAVQQAQAYAPPPPAAPPAQAPAQAPAPAPVAATPPASSIEAALAAFALPTSAR